MPTGYTSKIAGGITFKEFATDCMRAFGACVALRDDPAAPIPEEFSAGSYHLECIKDSEDQLEKTLTMLLGEAEQAAEDDYQERLDHLLEMLDEMRALRKSYGEMLEQAKNWKSPSLEHDNFKKFMVDQITSSIEHDCSEDFYTRSLKELTRKSGMEWMDARVEELRKNIAYHQASYNREQAQANKSTEWVKAIRATFK